MGITQNTLQARSSTLTLGTIESPRRSRWRRSCRRSPAAASTTRPYFVRRSSAPTATRHLRAERRRRPRALAEDAADCEIDLLRGVVTGGTGTGRRPRAAGPWSARRAPPTTRPTRTFYGGDPGQLVDFVWYGDKDANIPGAGFGGQIPASIWQRVHDGAARRQSGPCRSRLPGRCAAAPARRSSTTGVTDRAVVGARPERSAVPTTPPPTVIVNPPTTAAAGRRRAPPATTRPPDDHADDRAHDAVAETRSRVPCALGSERERTRAAARPPGARPRARPAPPPPRDPARTDGAGRRRDHRRARSGRGSPSCAGRRATTSPASSASYEDEAQTLSEQATAVEKRMYSGEISSPRELQAMQADVEQLRRHQQTVEERAARRDGARRAARRPR